MAGLELPKTEYQIHRQIEIKNLYAFFITLKRGKNRYAAERIAKRLKARYDSKIVGKGLLEVSSDEGIGMDILQKVDKMKGGI